MNARDKELWGKSQQWDSSDDGRGKLKILESVEKFADLIRADKPVLEDIEQYRLQMAGICNAAIGYWKNGDNINPDYNTLALRDVAKLYAKYDELYKAQAEQKQPGCACRWDSEGDRVVTCARHEGWLEVVAEWADRAREAEKKLKALAQPIPHDVIAGALFDFMAWLTSRPKRIMLSSVDDALPAVDAIKDFAKLRGLSLDDVRVQTWQDSIKENT